VTRCGASRTQEMLDEANRRLGRPAVQMATVVSVGGY
jgi:hypothetical protein